MDPSLPRPAPPRSLVERAREWVVWFGAGRLVATGVAVLAVVVGGTWLLEGSPSRVEDSLPFATRSSTTTVAVSAVTSTPAPAPAATTPAAVVVHVAGAVVAPGVYTLAPPARVTDAVAAAGGAAAGADLDLVNLAATLHDGERIFVPLAGQPIPTVVPLETVPVEPQPPGPVDINTASVDQLDVLPGVGPATAAAIVSHREQHGPFQSVEQLADVRGIGPAKLDALRGLVTV